MNGEKGSSLGRPWKRRKDMLVSLLFSMLAVLLSCATNSQCRSVAGETLTREPKRIDCPSPEYPMALRFTGAEGTIMIRYMVDADGRPEPESTEVVSSSFGINQLIKTAAIRVAEACRYRPGYVGNSPVRVMVQHRIEFSPERPAPGTRGN